jgi:DNA/RNA-binding protein KIN17
MCQKQCRDENGFKCHINTEAHQRQMLLFGQNSGSYTYQFSKDFFDAFMDILRRQFGTKRVKANKVYQQVIAHKDHVHMNATRWHTLTGFCMWLGKSGICVVDNIDEEWWLTYIDRDPETLERKRKEAKKKKMDKDDEERLLEFIEQQVERDKKRKEGEEVEEEETETKFTELVRENEEDKIKLDLKLFKKPEAPAPLPPPAKIAKIDNSDTMSVKSYKSTSSTSSMKSNASTSSKKSALDEIMEQEERKKEQKNRKDYWLAEGIVVKVMTKSLGSDYYKQKAVVQEVIDKYRAKIKLLESGEKFKIDQEHLETVIPKVDGRVRVLNGAYRDSVAILRSIETSRFSVTIEIEKGCFKGRVVSDVPYEDVSKLYDK